MEKALKQEASDCIKIVLFGPESTGKTTLAKQLAAHYDTLWVPEYMRKYLQEKWNKKRERCTKTDLLPIAEGQMKAENEASKSANRILFCDTNLLEIKLYSEYYYDGFCPVDIEKYSAENKYDFYFLTYIDTEWEIDDLRDRPYDREKMFRIFETQLIDYHLQYEILKGTQDHRFEQAIHTIEKLLKEKK